MHIRVEKNQEKPNESVDAFGPITLKENMYWAMGDNRKNSHDSRNWGALHGDTIKGRASFVIFSIDSQEQFWLFDIIKRPLTFWTKQIRWNRFFKSLNTFNGKIA